MSTLTLVHTSPSTATTGSGQDLLTCSGSVGSPCTNPAHEGAVLALDITTFELTCPGREKLRALGTGTCVECGELHSITKLLVPNAGLVEGVRNGAITAKLGLPSAWPEVLKKFITTCFAMVQHGGTQHLCTTCAEPGMQALAATGGYQEQDGTRVPPFIPTRIPVVEVVRPIPTPPPPPAAKLVVVRPISAPPMPPRSRRMYFTLEALVHALTAGRLDWRRGEDGLTECVVHLNAPHLCNCGGSHDWKIMPAHTVNGEGKPKHLGVGPACAEMIDAHQKKNGLDPLFADALSLAKAVLGEKYRAPTWVRETPTPRLRTAEEIAQADQERAAREAKRAERRVRDTQRRWEMKGGTGGGGGKKNRK